MSEKAKRFFSDFQERQIIEAIKSAEKQTSGEIRLHVEAECLDVSPIERAKQLFTQLKMEQTKERNGILFYLAHKSRKFAIWGDSGIHAKVKTDFWDTIKNESIDEFKNGRFSDGLVASILKCGQELKSHFPYESDDTNELPNEISY
jgi:uncharacterized membrane protein